MSKDEVLALNWQRENLTGYYYSGRWKVRRWHDERDNWYSVYFDDQEVRDFRNNLEKALAFPTTEEGRALTSTMPDKED